MATTPVPAGAIGVVHDVPQFGHLAGAVVWDAYEGKIRFDLKDGTSIVCESQQAARELLTKDVKR
jgi:hypothetical protein